MFVQAHEVSVRYARGVASRPAVDGVSLSLQAGQIGVLLGPSGCGKTSLLRALAGLERPSAGRIEMDGEVLDDVAAGRCVPAERRRIGMVFQDFALFPHMSVADNVAYGLHGLPRARRRERVEEMLALVGLAHAEKRAPHELSGGQQQRVALARALAPSPRLLLLDEPFSSLDVELRERLAHDVRQILRRHGTTALMVTHDQLEAFAMGDAIGVMNQGRLEQWGDAHTLYHHPASRFVAQFIGHGVLAPARVVADEAGRRVETPLGALAPRAGVPGGDRGEGECDVLLRADDVVHDDASPVKARLERKAFRGAEFLYTLRLADGQQVLAHVSAHHDHQVGDWIGIRPTVERVVLFERVPAA